MILYLILCCRNTATRFGCIQCNIFRCLADFEKIHKAIYSRKNAALKYYLSPLNIIMMPISFRWMVSRPGDDELFYFFHLLGCFWFVVFVKKRKKSCDDARIHSIVGTERPSKSPRKTLRYYMEIRNLGRMGDSSRSTQSQ